MLNYFLINGRMYDECDLHHSFEIVTGKKWDEDTEKYSMWINSLLGESIVSVKKDEDLTVGDILRGGSDKCSKIKGQLTKRFFELFPALMPQAITEHYDPKQLKDIIDKWIHKNISKRLNEMLE